MDSQKALPLQFVNLGQDAPSLGAEQRRSVRSHAMLGFMREQREKRKRFGRNYQASTSLSEEASSSSPAVEEGDLDSKLALAIRPARLQKGSGDAIFELVVAGSEAQSPPVMTSQVSPSKLDPFNTMSLPLEPYMDNAIQFANYFFPRFLYPQSASTKYATAKREHYGVFHMAVEDQCVLHALLAVAIFLMQGPNPNRELTLNGLKHRGHALHMIRQLISKGDHGKFERLIVAITWLVPIEVFLGSVEAHRAHMKAIRMLSREIGGLPKLDPLRYYILEADHRSSTIFDIKPNFTFEELGCPLSCTRYIQLPTLKPSTIHEVMAEITRLQNFLYDKQPPRSNVEISTNARMFLDIRCLIHHSLLALKPIVDGIAKCLRHALLMYINLVFRAYLPSGIIWISVGKRLRSSLLEMDQEVFKGREEILLWILFVAATPLRTAAPELRKWYVGAASVLCGTLELESWEVALERMSRVIVPPEILKPEYLRVWRDVRELAGERDVRSAPESSATP